MQRQFELCVETLQACEAAVAGGADRIELCAALTEGGVTPGHGFLHEAMATASLPVHVLLRPRSGNFVYSAAEFRMIAGDMEDALAAGAAGVVVGLLTVDGTIDTERTAELIRLAAGRSVTFHRAFDRVADQASALETLIGLGCHRVLTSGGRPTVTEGKAALAALALQARSRIRVAAGGGITLDNAPAFTAIQGLDLHASLRRKSAAVAGDPLWNDMDSGIAVDDVRRMHSIVHAV